MFLFSGCGELFFVVFAVRIAEFVSFSAIRVADFDIILLRLGASGSIFNGLEIEGVA